MSNRHKEPGDWRSSPDAFLRSARADHEASASDFERVQAQLARRLAASGAESQVGNVDKPAIGPKASFAKVSVAKLWIGLSLLAAGSFAVVRMLDVEPGRAPRPASTLQTPPVTAAGPALDSAPELTAPTPAPAQDSAPPVGRARHEASARVPPRRPGTSASAASNVAKELSALSAAGLRAQASTEHGAAAPSPSSRPAPAATSESPPGAAAMLAPQPRAAAAPGSQPRAAVATGSQPRAAAAPSSQPRAAAATGSQPRAAAATGSQSRAAAAPSSQPRAAAAPDPQPRAAETLEPNSAVSEASTGPTPPRPPAPKPGISAAGRAELALVERMQAAMRAGKPAAALALSAEHAKRWPAGMFSEEREAVSAIASCTLRTDDAVLRARRFLREHPHAPTAPRVAAACALPRIERR